MEGYLLFAGLAVVALVGLVGGTTYLVQRRKREQYRRRQRMVQQAARKRIERVIRE